MYPRSIQPFLEELLTEFRVLYLTGPRQAGKTTLARAVAVNLGMDYITWTIRRFWLPLKRIRMGLFVPWASGK